MWPGCLRSGSPQHRHTQHGKVTVAGRRRNFGICVTETQDRRLFELEQGDDGGGPCAAWISVASTLESSPSILYFSIYRPSTPDRYLCAREGMRESWKSLSHNNSDYEYINSEIQREREYTIVRGIIDQVCRLAVSPAGGYWAGRRRLRAAKNGTRQSAAGLRTGYTSRVPAAARCSPAPLTCVLGAFRVPRGVFVPASFFTTSPAASHHDPPRPALPRRGISVAVL